MSRRARALGFLLAALVCAALAAAAAGRYRSGVEARYGPLRPVVVAARDLAAGRPIAPSTARRALVVRRVPRRFVPPGALGNPAQALGQAPVALLPAGSYVQATQLSVPAPAPPPAAAATGRGRRPVQVSVRGAEALLVGGASPEGERVDVVVSEQPGLGRKGRTYLAAEGVMLLSLNEPVGAGEGWTATLALTRPQALDLISAEASARQVRLLPMPGAAG